MGLYQFVENRATTLLTSVQQCINNFAAALTRNKTLILQCIGFTFLWGLIAHGYMFANGNLSFDSLCQVIDNSGPHAWKVTLGRILVPRYEFLARGFFTIPWLIGMLGLFYISVATFFTAKIFNIKSPITTALVAGILTVNHTTIGLIGTIISDFDADMLAMLLAVVSVYCWEKLNKGWLWGAFPLFIALCLYQSYISTAITLIIFVCIWRALQGMPTREIVKKGLLSIAMILLAGIMYIVAIKVLCLLRGTVLASGGYNSLDAGAGMTFVQILTNIKETYLFTLHRFFVTPTDYRESISLIIHIALFMIIIFLISKHLCNKSILVSSKVLVIVLLILLPLGMNIARVLANNMSHDMMHFAIWLIYLFAILISCWNVDFVNEANNKRASLCKYICYISVFVILFWNVRLANAAYYIKDLEHQANLSLFTRILNDVEDVKLYKTSETQLAFIGKPTTILSTPLQKNAAYKMHGMGAGFPIGDLYYQAYFNYILMNPAKICRTNELNQLLEHHDVSSMPLYPAEGSIQMIDDVLVVKLGEVEVQP